MKSEIQAPETNNEKNKIKKTDACNDSAGKA